MSSHDRIGPSAPAALAPLRMLLAALAVAAVACAEPGTDDGAPGADGDDAAANAIAIADRYAEAYFEQYPEEAFEAGYSGAPGDRWSDRSADALAAWAATEDSLLQALRAIDAAALDGTEAAIPYAYALDRLEASVGRRVCRLELWNVSPTWTGWPEQFPTVLSQQPVRSAAERADLLARVRDIPRFLDTDVANLRAGLEAGYVAARADVDAVIAQVDALIELDEADSPFLEPAGRADDAAFGDTLAAAIRAEVLPAVSRYRDFLADEYAPSARADVGVSANPDGAACYRAQVRHYVTLDTPAEQIHQTGLREMERIQGEMRAIAQRLFGTDDLGEALRLAQGPDYTFRSEQDILDYAGAAVARAEQAMPRAFGFVPDAEVVIRPYPAFQKRTGGGFYSAGPEGEPGVYQLGTYAPAELSKAGLEATAFHETWPGHHLQAQVVLARGGAHPVLKYFYNSGMGEGWALYTERLADELGLYSGDIDRLGMLSNEALRAARLVVDPGMHALGWTREQAVEYMRENTAEAPSAIDYEVDRYIAVPGQATAYLIGSLEIQRLRRDAEERLGDAFDLRAFHDRVLENGTISLAMLGDRIERWVAEVEAGEPPPDDDNPTEEQE
jgi:uncharacterized protein (DUF885 family)